MKPTIRCNCGWSSQVSEYYLGDRVGCPQCGEKIDVRENSGVPYGYSPYPTWRKVPKPPRPRKVAYQPTYDPNASPAFWLGLSSLALVAIGIGFLPGILLAMFAVRSGVESKRYCRAHGVPRSFRARAGFTMGVSAILVGLIAVAATICMHTCPAQHRSHRVECQVIQPQAQNEYRYNQGGVYTGEDEIRERGRYDMERVREELRQIEMRRCGRYNSRYCPAEYPEATPVVPKTEFQRYQHEYSDKVARQRAEAAESN